MPGVPGRGGRVPKRTDQKHGHRSKAEKESVDKAPGASDVPIPPADDRWHPIALAWYESLAQSGQKRYYEPSDWATAVLIAESISRDLMPQFVAVNNVTGESIHERIPMKGASLAGYLKAFTALVVTEGDRRRARIELERGDSAPVVESVPNIDDYRDRLSG